MIIPVLTIISSVYVLSVAMNHYKYIASIDPIMFNNERKRVVVTAVGACGVLTWLCVYASMPQIKLESGVALCTALLALTWPILLMAMDCYAAQSVILTSEQRKLHTAETKQCGQYIIGAIFIGGSLLSVTNELPHGHSPQSAHVMLAGLITIMSILLPSPVARGGSLLTWLVYSAQCVAMHASYGLFIQAMGLAWLQSHN